MPDSSCSTQQPDDDEVWEVPRKPRRQRPGKANHQKGGGGKSKKNTGSSSFTSGWSKPTAPPPPPKVVPAKEPETVNNPTAAAVAQKGHRGSAVDVGSAADDSARTTSHCRIATKRIRNVPCCFVYDTMERIQEKGASSLSKQSV